ncbi:MAG: HU family DNA-binding protein [Desulfobacterales bacterium]|uniref:HU family DNA-binding protein n=1 Tax=Candidatus Desulfatibia vada TaxID=2841696 RepID=A0A8J6TTC0_9BACT|nr:HU family DNA-binding protein [Candidatus Desulfatibia vada]MBL6972247.1 HU family DNA-binding protein [Desulfobacterales bacterium]
MTKTELINEMSTALNSTKEAQAAIESLLSTITAALKKGDLVTLTGFGTFKVSKRKAREGRNPRTGEKIKIKAKKVAQFVPGKSLKEAVN